MPNTERESLTIRCSSCGQLKPMQAGASYSHTVEHEIEDVGFYQERFMLRLLVCSGCGAVNLAVEDEERHTRVWHIPLTSDMSSRSISDGRTDLGAH